MEKEKITSKFGKGFIVNEATYVMGINHRIADKIALRFKGYQCMLDACAGAGFLSIAFAKYVSKLIAVDINRVHLAMAEQNAEIAGVRSKINFLLGDVSSDTVLNSIGDIDAANMDMDWAEGEDKKRHVKKLSQMTPPADLLFKKIRTKTQNISMRLPKEFDVTELKNMPPYELEQVYLDGDFKFYMAYFGNLIQKIGDTRLEV